MRHSEIHLNMVSCQICKKTFNTKNEAQDHLHADHYVPKREMRLTCGICRESFLKGRELKRHLWIIHGKDQYAGLFT